MVRGWAGKVVSSNAISRITLTNQIREKAGNPVTQNRWAILRRSPKIAYFVFSMTLSYLCRLAQCGLRFLSGVVSSCRRDRGLEGIERKTVQGEVLWSAPHEFGEYRRSGHRLADNRPKLSHLGLDRLGFLAEDLEHQPGVVG